MVDWREIPVRPTPVAVKKLKEACPTVESLPFDPIPKRLEDGVNPSPVCGFSRAHPMFFGDGPKESHWREGLWSELEVFLRVRPRKLHWDEVILGFLDLVGAVCRRASEFFLEPSMGEALRVCTALRMLGRLCQEGESKGVSSGTLSEALEVISGVLEVELDFLTSSQSLLLSTGLLDAFKRCLPLRPSCWVEFALQCHACAHRGVKAEDVLEDVEELGVEDAEECRGRVERAVDLAVRGLEDRIGELVGRYRLSELMSMDVEEFAERVSETLADALALHAKPVVALVEEPEGIVERWLSVPEDIEVDDVKVPPGEYDPMWRDAERTERAFARVDVKELVKRRFRKLIEEIREALGSGR